MHAPDAALRELFGAPLDRRRFLKSSIGGVALLSLGTVLPAGCRSYPKPAVSLRFFNSREYATMNAVGDRLLDGHAMVGPDPERIDVAARVDALVADWDADAQGQLRTALRVFEHGTYLFDLQRKRFTRLKARQQDEYVAGWMNSTLGARRIVFRALKALTAAGFYQDPRTWSQLGYDGPWLGRIDAAARLQPESVTAANHLPPSPK